MPSDLEAGHASDTDESKVEAQISAGEVSLEITRLDSTGAEAINSSEAESNEDIQSGDDASMERFLKWKRLQISQILCEGNSRVLIDKVKGTPAEVILDAYSVHCGHWMYNFPERLCPYYQRICHTGHPILDAWIHKKISTIYDEEVIPKKRLIPNRDTTSLPARLQSLCPRNMRRTWDSIYLLRADEMAQRSILYMEKPDSLLDEIAATCKPSAEDFLVILVPQLTPVNMEYLGCKYDLDPQIFEDANIWKHVQYDISLSEYCGGHVRSKSGTLSRANRLSTLTIETQGDFFFDRNRSIHKEIIDAAESCGLESSMWPKIIGDSEAQYTSRTTIHCWRNQEGGINVMILLSSLHEADGVKPTFFSRSFFEYDDLHKMLSVNGYPKDSKEASTSLLHFPERFKKSRSYSDNELINLAEAGWMDLATKLTQSAKNQCKSAEIALCLVLFCIWPEISTSISNALFIDFRRFEKFRNLRHQTIMKSRDEWIEYRQDASQALDMIENRIDSQLQMLFDYEQRLSLLTDTIAVDSDTAKPDLVHEALKQMRRLRLSLDNLARRCKQQREYATLEEQRHLTNKQIEETQKSIDQNNLIRKVTVLAFFFIPISAVTSAFGMNLIEIQNGPPNITQFATATLGVTLVAILLAALPTIRLVDRGILDRLEGFHGLMSVEFSSSSNLLQDLREFFYVLRFSFHWKTRTYVLLVMSYKWLLTGIPRLLGVAFLSVLDLLGKLRDEGKACLEAEKAERAEEIAEQRKRK